MNNKKLIVANWKMNPVSLREAILLARAEDKKNVIICPPFPFLPAAGKTIKKASLGAQDVFWLNFGAYTGEISPLVLKKLNIEYAIVGHSERRTWLGETDGMINKKLLAALEAGLKVILCVGESNSVRRKGLVAAKRYVANQLREDLKGLKKILHSKFFSPRLIHLRRNILNSHLIVAYEPVWAIGSGKSDKPADAVEMAKFIKSQASGFMSQESRAKGTTVRVLYGGSVNSKNINDFLRYKEIGGALVGGASIKGREFIKIINIIK